MEMREVLNREGRDAKNLVVYQFCDETSCNKVDGSMMNGDSAQMHTVNCHRKPPVAPPKSPNHLVAPSQTPKKCISPTTSSRQLGHKKQCNGPRVRSASTGRDKRSELQARYWALLFGNLQRAINEIYQTVECYENISSCQEAILVLENYVRDFKALSEWFKVSWDYESRPLQQRPHSLAWEVRKSNPAPPVRTKSLTSPTASGKSSPALVICNSGKTSPCCGFVADVQSTPRKLMRVSDQLPKGAMRVNVRELFAANKKPNCDRIETPPVRETPTVAVESTFNEKHIVLEGKSHQYSQTDLEDDHLTLADLRVKLKREEEERLRQQEELEATRQREEAHNQNLELDLEENNLQVVEAQNQLQDVTEGAKAGKETSIQSLCYDHTEDEQQFAKYMQEDNQSNVVNNMEMKVTDAESIQITPKPQTALELTVRQLDAMENTLLAEQSNKSVALPKVVQTAAAVVKSTNETSKKPQTLTTIAANVAQNSPLKYSSVLNRPVAPRTNTQKTALTTVPNKTTVKPKNATNSVASNSNGLRRCLTVINRQSSQMRKPGGAATQPQPPPRPSSKTECYGPPNNVASRLSARSRTMLDMNGNNSNLKPPQKHLIPATNFHRNVKTNSVKLSSEDIGSSSSTLKASNEHIEQTRNNRFKDEERYSEPKQLPADANDGWLTVKTRRRSSLYWTNRFNQPTGYASLPTLALLNEKQDKERSEQIKKTTALANNNSRSNKSIAMIKATSEKVAAKTGKAQQKTAEKSSKQALVRPEIKNVKAKVNSLPVQRKIAPNNVTKTEKNATVNTTQISNGKGSNAVVVASRQSIMKRQKSDVTGLKMTSLHKEYMRSEKNAQRKQQLINDKENSNVSSSTETVVEAPINNQTFDVDVDVDTVADHNKIDIKIQTNREFSKTIGELYESIARTNKIEKLTNGCTKTTATPMLSSYDENDENALASGEDGDEERNERMLVEEQELLERQIRELESTEIDVDTETDETDCEVVLEDQEECNDPTLDDASAVVFVTMSDDDNANLELRYQALLSEMSWNERAETLATLQAYVARHPGRAQQLHQKLSSPSRRRSLQETLKKYQAKQARAQQKRELLQKEKAIKIQQLLTRVEDVKTAKIKLIEDKRLKMEGRLQRAAENREQFLRQIVEKAHDEEKKLKEINFIKNIEAQNKRLDLIESSKETEGRLQDLEQERQKRLEEKAAKEAAVERRRLELEKERQRKLEKMEETRLEKEQRIGKMQEQKERQRQALAREKARDREERLLALQAQQQQTTEELQRKIQQKQLESARRHEENIEHIRQRALELSIPSRNVEGERMENENGDTVVETVSSELSNGATNTTSEDCDHSSTLSDVGNREHSRSYKKKMKKLKQRMAQSAAEYFKEIGTLPAYIKRESQVPKLLNLITKGGGPHGLERALGNLLRLLPKAQVSDFQTLLYMDGLGIITDNVISKGMEEDADVSKKSVILAVQLYRNACSLCPQIARHALLGNSIISLFDAIIKSLQLPEEKSPQQPVELSTELMLACTEALSSKYVKKSAHPMVPERLPDMINYAVITGLIEKLARRCMQIHESVEDKQSVMLSLLTMLGFLSRFIDVCPYGPADPTRLLSAAKSTELFGIISMLNASVVPIDNCIPKRTISLAASAFNLLVSFANLDLNTFQDIVASETVYLKLFDVVTTLLKYCGIKYAIYNSGEAKTLLIDLIATISYFCVNNRKNQDLLTAETCAIVKYLSQLSECFNPLIYPCCVTISYKNQSARNVIAKDFNMELLDEYRKSNAAKTNHFICLIKNFT